MRREPIVLFNSGISIVRSHVILGVFIAMANQAVHFCP